MNYEKIIKSMKANKRDWEVAKQLNIDCAHRDGSHYVFKHALIRDNLSIPRHKDLHPDYITKFIRFTEKIQILEAELEKSKLTAG